MHDLELISLEIGNEYLNCRYFLFSKRVVKKFQPRVCSGNSFIHSFILYPTNIYGVPTVW